MFKNFIVVAIRHFKSHKLFFAINILCLSIGLVFSFFIGQYVWTQMAVNKNLNDLQDQYFLKSHWKEKDLGLAFTTPSPLARVLKDEYPGMVKNYYRYSPTTNVISSGVNHFKEDIAIGDTTLVTVYGFPLLYGDPNKAFANNSSAVITESFAKKLFGTNNAIGKTLTVQTTLEGMTQDYSVSAVIKDIPYNSVTGFLGDHYSVFIPATGSKYYQSGDPTQGWENANVVSFVQLSKTTSPTELATPLKNLLKKYTKEKIWKNLTINVVPVKDYYLDDHNASIKKMIFILSMVAVFILLMVIINFINISIGTSSYRLKEIGLRKTFGGAKTQVILQFMTESILLAFIAGLISLVLYQLLLPVFSDVFNTHLPGLSQLTLTEFGLFLLFAITIGILAGLYPALVLSSVKLTDAVKGKMMRAQTGINLRRLLLIVQFSLAILVFICAINLSKQVHYLFNKDLGYNREQVMIISAFPKQWDSSGLLKMETVKKGLEELPFVKEASLTYNVPEGTPDARIILYPPKSSSSETQLNLPLSFADEEYAKTFGIKMVAGNFFSQNKDGIVLNEAAVNQLGLTDENAVGAQLRSPVVNSPIEIMGVMKNYNFSSLHDHIEPIGFIHVKNTNVYRYVVVKLHTSNMPEAINQLKTTWKSFLPNSPFDYSFMDEKFAALYQKDLQLQQASNIATALNMIIVLLGILGIVALMLTRKTKEIAIRKVLGAKAQNILFLFLKEYAALMIIANIIAWPLAYLVTEKLLQNFADHVGQHVYPYLLVMTLVFVLAFALILIQTFKAATANPVESLRTE